MNLIEHFEKLWLHTRPAFAQDRTWLRAKRLALSALVCLGRRTLTGMLSTAGLQFHDWSADYRLFGQWRFEGERLFDVARQELLDHLPRNDALVVSMDDTLLRKTGKKITGTAWRRDPLGPPFQANLIWAQRFVQISAALPEAKGSARMVPIALAHCPTPKKPRHDADEETRQLYRQEQKRMNLSKRTVQQLQPLRHRLDHDRTGKNRSLITAVDGGYTNATVLRALPERTTLIGRIRKDAKLYALPRQSPAGRPGRKPDYGKQLPTPEQFRQDSQVPWIFVKGWCAGKTHDFQVKTLEPVRWRTAGAKHNLRLIVIRPLGYRLSAQARVLYRKPVYLICTDPGLPLQQLLQAYLWRWEIEVNFRDEKTILGVGQAQVRTPASVENVPTLMIASYALMLLAAQKAFCDSPNNPALLPRPKWQRKQTPHRVSTQQMISQLRAGLWGKALAVEHFSHFANSTRPNTTPQNHLPQLASAVLYASP